MKRSIAMLQPGAQGLRREEAMQLIADLYDVQRRLEALRAGLVRLLDEQ